jgi:equilibrative nucleoside transporter 1/2/3
VLIGLSGQGIAGVLPAIAQIVSVLAIPQRSNDQTGTASPKAALAYFFTATFVSGICFCLFLVFLVRHGIGLTTHAKPLFEGHYDSEEEEETRQKKAVSLFVLLRKLKYLSFAIWLDFCVTMVFPVFTEAIVSVRTENTGRMFQPDVFIPIAFLLWNMGDLLGRILCGWPRLTTTNPMVLVVLAIARVLFIPLYFMCNIRGQGADIESDSFYWLVQLVFGFTNGWIGSNCMMAAPSFVDENEMEASGSFMGLCLVVGLACGSVLSFFLLNV